MVDMYFEDFQFRVMEVAFINNNDLKHFTSFENKIENFDSDKVHHIQIIRHLKVTFSHHVWGTAYPKLSGKKVY